MSGEAHDARCEREFHKGVLILDCLCRTRSLMAQAWDEGFNAGERDVFEHERQGDWDSECIRNPYSEPICDHPGIDHGTFSYTGICPRCGLCKFIGHGPLCIDCYCDAACATQPGGDQ